MCVCVLQRKRGENEDTKIVLKKVRSVCLLKIEKNLLCISDMWCFASQAKQAMSELEDLINKLSCIQEVSI